MLAYCVKRMFEEGSPSWSSVRKGSSAPRFEPLTSRKKPGLAHRTSRARTVLEAIFHPMGPVATAMDLTNTPDLFDCSSWKHHAAIRYIARFLTLSPPKLRLGLSNPSRRKCNTLLLRLNLKRRHVCLRKIDGRFYFVSNDCLAQAGRSYENSIP